MRNTGIILKPVVSEKSFRLAGDRQYTFLVDPRATAADVAHAVSALYSVAVTSVRTLNRMGKLTRYKGVAGQRLHIKKAIVRLKAGQSIKGFEVPVEPTVEDPKKSGPKRTGKANDVTTTVRAPKGEVKKAQEINRSSSTGQSPKDVA